MKSLKFTSLFALLVLCMQSISAQQVYESDDYGGPGTIYLYNRLTGILPIEEVTKTGADVTWDLSAFGELNTHPVSIVAPDQAIDQVTFLTICSVSGLSFLECFSIWTQTEQAVLLKDSISLFGFTLVDIQRFQNKTNNLLLENFFGFNVDFSGMPTQAVIVYQEPDTIFHFPLSYGDSWTSHINWGIDLTPTGQNIVYESMQTRTSEVDAWGTLMTPYDTFENVIRLRSEIEHQDTLYSDSLNIPVNLIQVEYMWFDTAYKLPVMVASGIVTDSFEVINVIEYIYEDVCETPTWTVDVGEDVFYTDSSGTVTVDFLIENSNAGTYVWDFGDGSIETSSGNISHTYSEPGSYSVAVSGCMTNCLPLNSCTSQIIDFEVLVSTDNVPGDELGITLYPNPAKEMLHLDIPSGLNLDSYKVLNAMGQIVIEGKLNNNSSISLANISSGIFTIQLKGSEAAKYAVMRFVVAK